MKKKSVTIRNMLIRGLVPLALLSSSHVNAQFMADPLTNAPIGGFPPWVGVGAQVPTIAGGVLDLSPTNGHGGVCNYVYRSLRDNTSGNVFTLNTTNAWSWTAQFKFTPSSTLAKGVDFLGNPVPGIPGHTLLALTSGTDNSVNQCQALYQISPMNDIEIDYTCSALTGTASTSNNWYLIVNTKKTVGNTGTFTVVTTPIFIDPVASNGVPFYIQLQMLTQGEGKISVYQDAAFSNLITSQCFSIDWGVTGLNYVQSGIVPQGGSYRALNATIQNLNIWNNSLCLDYTTAANDWVKTPLSGGTVYTTASSYTFSNSFDNVDNRIDKNIGSLISTSQVWTATEHLNISSISTSGPGHDVLALSSNSATNVFVTPSVNQDVIVAYLSGSGTNSDCELYGRSKHGTNNWTISPSSGIPLSVKTDYYIVLQRLCPTVGQVSVYKDAAHTSVVGTQTFSIDPALTGLNNVQIGTQQWGSSARELNAEVDNVCINNDWYDGGSIASSQTVCPGVAGPAITAAALPTLGACGGTISYYWEKAIPGTPVGSTGWTVIPGATSASYSLGPLSTSTSFIRYASNMPGSCVNWWSNVVTYSVDNVVLDPTFAYSDNPISATNFTMSATANMSNSYIYNIPLAGYAWQVCQLSSGNCISTTLANNPSQWWINTPGTTINYFPGYVGSSTLSGSSIGSFLRGNTYRVLRAVWKNCQTWTAYYQDITSSLTSRETSVINSGYLTLEEYNAMYSQHGPLTDEISLHIYPNPNNGTFSIESANYASGTPVEITDMMGRIVLSQSFTDLKHQNIDMSGFENGIYFIKIQGTTNYSTHKIIKE